MKCPRCQNEMKLVNVDESVNSENNKKYTREIYHCEIDDIWLNLETPKDKYDVLYDKTKREYRAGRATVLKSKKDVNVYFKKL